MIRRLPMAALALFAVTTFAAVTAAPAGALEPPVVPASGYSLCVALMGVGGVCV